MHWQQLLLFVLVFIIFIIFVVVPHLLVVLFFLLFCVFFFGLPRFIKQRTSQRIRLQCTWEQASITRQEEHSIVQS
jgi:hypothetical protein